MLYYAQVCELLQDRKTVLLHNDSMSDQARKNYSKKTSIINVSDLEKKSFKAIQKTFDDLNFLHHQNPNQHLYINLDTSKQYEFSVTVYHMLDDDDSSLNHTVKENHQKVQPILFLSKLLTDAETQY